METMNVIHVQKAPIVFSKTELPRYVKTELRTASQKQLFLFLSITTLLLSRDETSKQLASLLQQARELLPVLRDIHVLEGQLPLLPALLELTQDLEQLHALRAKTALFVLLEDFQTDTNVVRELTVMDQSDARHASLDITALTARPQLELFATQALEPDNTL